MCDGSVIDVCNVCCLNILSMKCAIFILFPRLNTQTALVYDKYCSMRTCSNLKEGSGKSSTREFSIASLLSLLKHSGQLCTCVHPGSSGRVPRIPGNERHCRSVAGQGMECWWDRGTHLVVDVAFAYCYQIHFEPTVYLSDRPCFNGQPSALEGDLSRAPGVSIGEPTGPVMLRRQRLHPESYYMTSSQ